MILREFRNQTFPFGDLKLACLVNRSLCPSNSHQASGSCYLPLKVIRVSLVNIWDFRHTTEFILATSLLRSSDPDLSLPPKSFHMLICGSPKRLILSLSAQRNHTAFLAGQVLCMRNRILPMGFAFLLLEKYD